MLYKKNGTASLDKELFKNPTSEYRGAPFWAFNCKLDKEELKWQLENFKKMGFGGAHMHVRTGLATPYLSDEYMDVIKTCVEKAKSEGMLTWLYDEDRFASGTGGGFVTKDECYRAQYLLFTPNPYNKEGDKPIVDGASSARISRNETGTLLRCYDIELDKNGCLVSCRVIDEDEPARYEKWYLYTERQANSPWYNNQSYVNTLDKKAIERFIDITYEAYNRVVGDEFDRSIPSIFTDEPHFSNTTALRFPTDKTDVIFPWTDDFPDTYAKAYKDEKILDCIPELVWERADGKVSVIRYHYHDHVSERFAEAFADTLGKWCDEHDIALTGHLMEEPTLKSQMVAVGDAMRSYRSFTLPGIDMLCARMEYTTAKQAQSAVHQYGREGMTTELYGVTNWDFDFRGHKLHGDWQAAMGATIRVHHLAWVSMAGEAKRDYPATINYQSPWWNKYSLIEDHFARLNTALSRGKPIVKVGVIHPIESYWLHWGPTEQTSLVREHMDNNFQKLTEWLSFGGVNFDFVNEALLPRLCTEASAPLRVGAMAYDVILVPECETLRSTTLERLESFVAQGGKLIFAGKLPTLENAILSQRGVALAKNSRCIPFNKSAILEEMNFVRQIELRDATGSMTDNLLYNLREDGEGRWLYVAHGKEPYNKDISQYQDLRIRVNGTWKVTLYNTMTGETEDVRHNISADSTEIYYRMYDYDSLLLWMEPVHDKSVTMMEDIGCCDEMANEITLPASVPYTLSEPNALLLDQAEYALDDGEWKNSEEILRLDDECRKQLGWSSRGGHVVQPWLIPQESISHVVHLRFYIESEIDYVGAQLAVEDAEKLSIHWNGQRVENNVTGWYVDKAIKTVALPPIKIGKNILEMDIPFGKATNVEWSYLLGTFGVEVSGRTTRIVAARKEISFGSITNQGLPFYGGNITYHIPINTSGGNVSVRSSRYRGVLQTIKVDDSEEIPVIYPPYTTQLDGLSAGEHIVHVTLYGHRRNSFGPVHLTDLKDNAIGPNSWRKNGEYWNYEYVICEEGILSSPVIVENRK